MTVNLPSATSLSELQATIEFIRLISTNEGLGTALQQISEARADLDTKHAEVNAASAKLTDDAKAIETARDEAQKVIDTAADTKKALNDQQTALTNGRTKLETDQQNFNYLVTNTTEDFTKRDSDLKFAEEAAKNTQTKADNALTAANALKAEYEGKLAEMKKITG